MRRSAMWPSTAPTGQPMIVTPHAKVSTRDTSEVVKAAVAMPSVRLGGVQAGPEYPG